MKHDRLQALTDGIFAIVMTLLVLEIKVPLISHPSNASLWHALAENKAAFASYLISFLSLFIFWRGHNYIISTLAKNLDTNLVNLNMLFLLLIGIIPFTTYLLGTYPKTQLAIIIYALNIIFIGLTLGYTRRYIEKSESIETDERTHNQRLSAQIRTLTPVVCSALAIPICFFSTWLAFAILLLGVGFNLLNNAADIIRKVFRIS